MAATDNSLLPADTGWYTPLDTGPSVSIGRSATPNPGLPVKDPKTPVSDVAANAPANTPYKNYDMKVVKDGTPDAQGIEGGDIVRTPKVTPTVTATAPATPKPDKGPDEAPFVQAASAYAGSLPETLRPVLQNIGPAYQKREAALKGSAPEAADSANATVAQHTKAALSDSAEYLKAQQDAMALAAKPKRGVNPLDAVREAWNNNALLYGHPSDMAASGDPTTMAKLVKARQDAQGVMQSSFDADQAQFAKAQAVQKLAIGAFPDFKQRTPEDQAVIMQAAQEHAQDKNSKVAVAALEALGRVEPSKQVAAREALDTPETKAALTDHFQRTQNTNYSDAAHQTTMLIQGHDTRAINWNGSPGPAFPSRAPAPPAMPSTYGMNDKDVEFAKMQYKARLDQWEKAQDVQRSDWEKAQESQRMGALQQQARDDQFKHEPPHPAMFTKEWEQQQPGYRGSSQAPQRQTDTDRRIQALQDEEFKKTGREIGYEEAAEKLSQIKGNQPRPMTEPQVEKLQGNLRSSAQAMLLLGQMQKELPSTSFMVGGLSGIVGRPIEALANVVGLSDDTARAQFANQLKLASKLIQDNWAKGKTFKSSNDQLMQLLSTGNWGNTRQNVAEKLQMLQDAMSESYDDDAELASKYPGQIDFDALGLPPPRKSQNAMQGPGQNPSVTSYVRDANGKLVRATGAQ